MQPTSPARPMGITILAVLSAIGGAFAILGSLALIGLSGALVGVGFGGFTVIAGLLLLVYGALSLAFAYGAWKLLPWAWMLGIGAQILSLGLAVVRLLTGGSIDFISIIIAGIIIYYLYTPDVKRAFGRP